MVTGRDLIGDISQMAELFEMAVADRDELGFQAFVYISSKANVKHGPRVKFSDTVTGLKSNDSFSVSIEDKPKLVAGKANAAILKKAVEWVALNREVLLNYWNEPLQFGTTKNFLKKLQPVG